MKRLLFFFVLLPLAGCAALNSGHYPTDVQRKVMAIPDGKTLFVVPVMGDTLRFQTIGMTIFGNSVDYVKAPDLGISQSVERVVTVEIERYKKFQIETPSPATLRALQAHVPLDRPPNVDEMLILARKRHAAYLMVIWAGGSLPPLLGKSNGGVGYGVEMKKIFNQSRDQVYCVERMAIYDVSDGKSVGNLVAVEQGKVTTSYDEKKPSKMPPQKLAKIKAQVLSFAEEATEANLEAFGLAGYFAEQGDH